MPIVGDLVKSACTSVAVGPIKMGKYAIRTGWEGVVVLIEAHEILIQF